MKILQLVPRFPFPEDDGGKIGIANIYKEFAKKGHEVTLFSLNHLDLDNNSIKYAEQFGKVVIFNFDTKNNLKNIFKALLSNKSIYINKHNGKPVYDFIDKLLLELGKDKKFDIVHADHTCMSPLAIYISKKLNIPVGQRLHNIEYKIWERYVDGLNKLNPKYYYLKYQSVLLKKEEQRLFNNIDVGFAITKTDMKIAKTLSPSANIVLASAGVDLDTFKANPKIIKNKNQLVIATTFNWLHNIEGLKWFINQVLPLIQKKIPDISLKIIGKNPPEEFYNYENLGVEVLGYVKSVIPYLQKANIYIAPLFVGSGIRIKILEALAMGLPVIATTVSAEGIEIDQKSGLFVNNDSSQQAKCIIELLKNKEKMDELSNKSVNAIKNKYSWQGNVEIMLNEYVKLLSS